MVSACETGVDAAIYCQHHLDIKVQSPIELPTIDHQFTHYKLRIHSQLLEVVSNNHVSKINLSGLNHPTHLNSYSTCQKAVKTKFLSDSRAVNI